MASTEISHLLRDSAIGERRIEVPPGDACATLRIVHTVPYAHQVFLAAGREDVDVVPQGYGTEEADNTVQSGVRTAFRSPIFCPHT